MHRETLGWGEVKILRVLQLYGRSYGYGIRESMRRLLPQYEPPAIGGIYTTLKRLIAKGYVTAQFGDETNDTEARRRYYTLTPAGLKAVSEAREELLRLIDVKGSDK